MDLRARDLLKKDHEPDGTTTRPVRAATSERAGTGRDGRDHLINVRYNTILYNTLQHMLRSSQAGQDFTFASVADVIRAALQAYRDGMVLSELDQGGPKTQTTLRVGRDLWQFYEGFPDRMRSKILERVIRTFVKEQFGRVR
jgi:hypothetical protein